MKSVYFIKPAGLDGPIKIGISCRPADRLYELSCASPLPLEMIGTVPASADDERFMHDCFADHHSHREWYRSSPKLREAIAEVLAAGMVSVLFGKLSRQKNMRAAAQQRRPLTADRRRFLSYNVRVSRRRGVPDDVAQIVRGWSSGAHVPTADQLTRLDQFLARKRYARHVTIPADSQGATCRSA